MARSEPTKRESRRTERGFTLLEALTAFVLFALTFAVLLQIFSRGLRDAQLADEYARATSIAQSRLAVFSASEKPEEGVSSGELGAFRWALSATAYDDAAEGQAGERVPELPLRFRLLRVESLVSWPAADGRTLEVRLTTLLMASKS